MPDNRYPTMHPELAKTFRPFTDDPGDILNHFNGDVDRVLGDMVRLAEAELASQQSHSITNPKGANDAAPSPRDAA